MAAEDTGTDSSGVGPFDPEEIEVLKPLLKLSSAEELLALIQGWVASKNFRKLALFYASPDFTSDMRRKVWCALEEKMEFLFQ